MMNNSEFLGSGVSREAYLLENGTVLKIARKDGWGTLGGQPNPTILDSLLLKFKNDKTVKKIDRLLKKNCRFGTYESGIIAEYLMTLELTQNYPELTKFFALCTELKVRKENNKPNITIKGIFEFADDKARPEGEFDEDEFYDKSGISIRDLHRGNFKNNIIVDYACIQ